MERRFSLRVFKFIPLLILIVGSPPSSSADEFSNNFQSFLNETSLNALAEDLGTLMGGGSFHQGKTVGFPVGFDLGVHVPILEVQSDNKILTDDGARAHALWAQAEVGLPGKINILGRVGSLYDADLYGGGVRYALLNPSLPGSPSFSLGALYSVADHDYFDLETYSFNAVLSVDFPFIHPYLGGGYDKSKLEPKDPALAGVPPNGPRDVEGRADGFRLETGVNFSVIPFTYFNFGIGIANSAPLYHLGGGVKF